MSKYRHRLPQLANSLFLTDGGLETTLIYHEHLDLPLFAAFDLLKDEAGTDMLRRYYERYAQLARTHGRGLVLEAPTWRANPDWAAKLGYDAPALADANRRAIGLMLEVRAAHDRLQVLSTAIEQSPTGVIVTDAALTKSECLVLAQGAHDGYARAITPPHCRVDGDAVVAAATGTVPAASAEDPRRLGQVELLRWMAVRATADALATLAEVAPAGPIPWIDPPV